MPPELSDKHVAAICRVLRVSGKCVVDEWSRAASSNMHAILYADWHAEYERSN